jgi:Na+/melibiose symporter-like transporter
MSQGGPNTKPPFAMFGLFVAVAAAVIIFVSAHFTRDQIPRLRQPPPSQQRATLKDLYADTLSCLRNRDYFWLLLGLIALGATIGVRQTLNSYLSLFFWELPERSIRLFALVSPPAYIIAFFATVRLHRIFEKRAAIIIGVAISVFAAIVPVTLRMLGAFPENGARGLFGLLLFFHFLFYLGFAVLTISVLSALADIADEHELITGKRQEGSFYAARTFFGQISSGFGHLLGGIALDAVGFVSGSKPGQVSSDVLFGLGLVDGPLACMPALVAIYFYARYTINRQRHLETQRELAARRKPAAAVVSEPPLAAGASIEGARRPA